MTQNEGWYGVDLDGTLAHYDTWRGPCHIGEPVPLMAERVRGWLFRGLEVRIFTARVYAPRGNNPGDEPRRREAADAGTAIRLWSLKHFGVALTVTCTKDFGMVRLYDDRAVRVEANTGKVIGGE